MMQYKLARFIEKNDASGIEFDGKALSYGEVISALHGVRRTKDGMPTHLVEHFYCSACYSNVESGPTGNLVCSHLNCKFAGGMQFEDCLSAIPQAFHFHANAYWLGNRELTSGEVLILMAQAQLTADMQPAVLAPVLYCPICKRAVEKMPNEGSYYCREDLKYFEVNQVLSRKGE